MPKVKIPRKNISLDMTAMCDVAFLLLSFFMLTTTFKPEEPLPVDTPSSVSDLEPADKNNIVISLGKEGQVFYGIEEEIRVPVLEKVSQETRVGFSQAQKDKFSSLAAFGLPVEKLPGFLDLESEDRAKVKKEGIPLDTPTVSDKNQLRTWIGASLSVARAQKRKLNFIIKGDGSAKYDKVKTVIATMQDFNINRFSLITSLERGPKKK